MAMFSTNIFVGKVQAGKSNSEWYDQKACLPSAVDWTYLMLHHEHTSMSNYNNSFNTFVDGKSDV